MILKTHHIVARVDAIRAMTDREQQHSAEDQLFADVLKAIAEDTALNPRACAKEALKSKKITFIRACS